VKPVVAVADNAFAHQERLVVHFAAQVTLRFADISTPEAIATATLGAEGIVVTLQPLRREAIEALDGGVKVIGRAGVGLDTIDLVAAESAGLAVVNEPAYGTVEVASHAVALLLSIQRKLTLADRYVRDGWRGRLVLGEVKPVDELTVGLVGCGRIGAAVAEMLRGMVGAVLAFDPVGPQLPEHVERVSTLEELLQRSDAVSLHVPLSPETAGLLSRERFALMQRGAVLVNTARGGLIDEAALAEVLQNGQLGGAALDVFVAEPLPPDSPLLHTPNTVLTPHVAAYSDRSAWRLASWTIEDTVSWIASKDVRNGSVAVRGTR
jgi:D-3-phosphoglycerate dehydrogenase